VESGSLRAGQLKSGQPGIREPLSNFTRPFAGLVFSSICGPSTGAGLLSSVRRRRTHCRRCRNAGRRQTRLPGLALSTLTNKFSGVPGALVPVLARWHRKAPRFIKHGLVAEQNLNSSVVSGFWINAPYFQPCRIRSRERLLSATECSVAGCYST
jgi:hypothetical protein